MDVCLGWHSGYLENVRSLTIQTIDGNAIISNGITCNLATSIAVIKLVVILKWVVFVTRWQRIPSNL